MIAADTCNNRKARSRLSIIGAVTLIALIMPFAAQGAELKYGPLPFPEVNGDTWVLIEIWPEVGDITLSAYFMDFSGRKNENLCEATKRSLDRDAAAQAKEQKREATTYRQCLTVSDALKAGYVEASK